MNNNDYINSINRNALLIRFLLKANIRYFILFP